MDIFISHSAQSEDIATKLAEALEDRGFSTWVDAQQLKPGNKWQDAIEKAIEDARMVVFLFEPRQPIGRWQQLEWSKALESAWLTQNKKLVSLLIDDAEPPTFLQNWQHLRIRRQARNWDDTVRNLIALWKTSSPRQRKITRGKNSWNQWLNRLEELKDEARTLKNADGDIELVDR